MRHKELLDPDVLSYLETQRLGRLATVDKEGAPQNNPVGFAVNRELGTVDIVGYNLASSRKFRNLKGNDKVAFVVDDIASLKPWRVRMVETRGHAEAIVGGTESRGGVDDALIRIYPRRVIVFGLEEQDQ